MRQIGVVFQYVGNSRVFRNLNDGHLRYIVNSNNKPMAVALAQNELWNDLHVRDGVMKDLALQCGVTRFDFKTHSVAFVAA